MANVAVAAREAVVVSNRRIGERVFLGAMALTWEPAIDTGAAGSAGGALRALLMNVSVTGAGLFGPTYPWIGVDDVVIVGFDGARAVVSVRRATRTDDPDLRYYGVEFVSLERAFETAVYQVIGRCRGSDPPL